MGHGIESRRGVGGASFLGRKIKNLPSGQRPVSKSIPSSELGNCQMRFYPTKIFNYFAKNGSNLVLIPLK
jgi:hypothetical protein